MARKKETGNKRQWLNTVIVIELVIVLGCCAGLLFTRNTADGMITAAAVSLDLRPKPTVDPNTGLIPTPAPTEPGIAIPGWGGIRLPAGKKEAEVSLYNPEDNAGWYYLTFELRLAETDEVIFTTGLVPPDMCCAKIELNRELEKGEYDAVMYVQPYRMNDDLTPTNNADFNLKLIVE